MTHTKTTIKTSTARSSPRLKNYTSQAQMASIFSDINDSLASHGANRISMDFENHRATAIHFILEVQGGQATFRLPAHIENVVELVRRANETSHMAKLTGDRLIDQAYRTAWANIRDWVAAQMAMIDSMQAKTEEVFMPYLLVDEHQNRTLFEAYDENRRLPVLTQPYLGITITEQ